MKVTLQDRPLYTDWTRFSSVSNKILGQDQSTLSSLRTDRVSISAESALRLSNKILETAMGQQMKASFLAAGVNLSDGVGMDFSPEATAKRIASFATGLLGVFRQQNPNLSETEVVDKFEETIRGAVDKGYQEAQQMLGTMNLPGSATSQSAQTMGLVHQQFDDFFAELRGPSEAAA